MIESHMIESHMIESYMIELIYWVLAIIIIHRFNRDLHRNIHHDDQYYWVESETTKWKGWVERR